MEQRKGEDIEGTIEEECSSGCDAEAWGVRTSGGDTSREAIR